MNFQTIALVVLGVWSLLLTVTTIILFSFFRRLSKSSKDLDLKKIFEKLLTTDKKNSDLIVLINKEINRIKEEDKFHIQRVGLVRFNPFAETGGDHSFALAILDGKNCGVVITGLHTRERTRVYLKAIKNGKSEINLSEDEKKAITKAQKM
jgi:hypothetical protein